MSKDNKAKKTKKRYRSLEKKTALWGLIFLLPWLIGLVFFFLRPLVLTFYYAFSSMEMENGVFKGTFNGIENFKYALGVDADFKGFGIRVYGYADKCADSDLRIAVYRDSVKWPV